MILYVCAIRKKDLKPKRKNLFDLRFFYLSRGKRSRRRRETKRGRTKRRAIHPPVNSNLPVEALLERKSITFYKQGKITPLLQKVIPEKKAKERA